MAEQFDFIAEFAARLATDSVVILKAGSKKTSLTRWSRSGANASGNRLNQSRRNLRARCAGVRRSGTDPREILAVGVALNTTIFKLSIPIWPQRVLTLLPIDYDSLADHFRRSAETNDLREFAGAKTGPHWRQ